MDAFAHDLNEAKLAGVAVEVILRSGEKLLTGVHEVRQDEGYVSLYAPRMMGDDETTRKVALDFIASVVIERDTPYSRKAQQ